jgi:Amidase
MTIVVPSVAELAKIAADLGFHFDAADVSDFRELMRGALDAYSALDRLPDALPLPRRPRLPGSVPSRDDNPFGAFARIVQINGEREGPLVDKRIVIKDCVCIAGVPMMNGSAVFEGYVPEIDATVVTRILDAGGTIVGKAANEDHCFSGGSHTNARYPVDNPHRSGFSAGGSSSGSAALVGGGVVDMAIGTDQGGSIRQPASCCGIVGMKATFGLVPWIMSVRSRELSPTMPYCWKSLPALTASTVVKLIAKPIATPATSAPESKACGLEFCRRRLVCHNLIRASTLRLTMPSLVLLRSAPTWKGSAYLSIAMVVRSGCRELPRDVSPVCFTGMVSASDQAAYICRRRCSVRRCGARKATVWPTRSNSACWSESICPEPMEAAITAERTIWRGS